jgi:hypothetical protein
MPVATLLAAAALSAPVLQVDFDDYPDKAMSLGRSAAILADVAFDPNGRMTRCETLNSLGDPDLAGRICKVFQSKRHKPARLADGSAAWFVERNVYKMFIPGTPVGDTVGKLRQPDAILDVAALPAGMRTLDAMVVVAVDANGDISDCGPDAGDEDSPIIQAVCTNADIVPHEVFRDQSGTPVPYVSRMRFRLQVAAADTKPAS